MNVLTLLFAAGLIVAAQHPEMPAGMSHEEHLKQMQKDEALKRRGADAMGFDQDATTHHFLLFPTGGAIEVTVKEGEQATIAAVRAHLKSIASDFQGGHFDKPFQTHGEVPPGVVEMQSRPQTISYEYEDLPQGGAVRIHVKDAPSLDAVHAFLRYQIREHRTGDPLQIVRSSGR